MDDGSYLAPAPNWPASYLEGMSEAQRCVMAPPYHPRLNRVAVRNDAAGGKAGSEGSAQGGLRPSRVQGGLLLTHFVL